MPLTRSFFAACLFVLGASAVFAGDEAAPTTASRTEIVVSIADQKLAVMKDGEVIRRYTISTSRFGLGDSNNSYRTPLGKLKISQKIGDGLAAGAVMKHRNATGEVLKPNAPGRDPIVSRIMWLDGLEAGNANAYARCVYIHGTPDEKHLGRPVSYGCIRMSSSDVIELYASTPVGTSVSIIKDRLPSTNPLVALLATADSFLKSSSRL